MPLSSTFIEPDCFWTCQQKVFTIPTTGSLTEHFQNSSYYLPFPLPPMASIPFLRRSVFIWPTVQLDIREFVLNSFLSFNYLYSINYKILPIQTSISILNHCSLLKFSVQILVHALNSHATALGLRYVFMCAEYSNMNREKAQGQFEGHYYSGKITEWRTEESFLMNVSSW